MITSKSLHPTLLAGALLAAFTGTVQTSIAQDAKASSPPAATPKPLASVDRCVAQEKFGDACSCWSYLKEKAPPKGAAELALTEMKAAACTTKPKEQAPAESTNVAFPTRTAEDATCYVGAKLNGAPSEILTELTNKCGGPTGMLPMTPVITGYQRKEDKPELYRVILSDKECYRFFAIGDGAIENIVAKVLDPDLKEMAVDLDVDRVKVLAPKKAICPTKSGLHAVWVSVAAGQGRYVLQGFRRLANAPPPVATDPKHQAFLDITRDSPETPATPRSTADAPRLLSVH
jgi:hypothetical protein